MPVAKRERPYGVRKSKAQGWEPNAPICDTIWRPYALKRQHDGSDCRQGA